MTEEPQTGAPEETGGTEQASEQRVERFVAFPKLRQGILETGEGSLLEHTKSLVEDHAKASVDSIDIGDGDRAIIQRNPDGGVSILDSADFDSWREKPLFLHGSPRITDLGSLIDYTNRFKDSDSVVFANDDRSSPSIAAVMDYHIAGEGPDHSDRARHGRHTATFPVPLSDEWKAWHQYNGQQLAMANFARFLEDHIVDVMPQGMVELNDEQKRFVTTLGGMQKLAEPAKLMELASGLQVFTEGEVQQAQRLSSGEGQITIKERHTDGKGSDLIVPSAFVIAIPVFRNGEPYQILVRLRYRPTSAGVTFFYELWRDDRVFDHAFDEAVQRVATETDLPVFRGSRE